MNKLRGRRRTVRGACGIKYKIIGARFLHGKKYVSHVLTQPMLRKKHVNSWATNEEIFPRKLDHAL